MTTLPPGLPPLPPPDFAPIEALLDAAVEAYAHAGYPTPDSPSEPLPVERQVEDLHDAEQQRITAWKGRAAHDRTAEVGRCDAARAVLADERKALEDRRGRLRGDLDDLEARAPDRERRFERRLPRLALLVTAVIALMEWPVLNPILGYLYDLSPRTQVLVALGLLGAMELLYAGTGCAIRRWIGDAGPPRSRRPWMIGALVLVLVSVLVSVAMAIVRTQLAGDPGESTSAAAPVLLVGIQFALFGMTVLLGYWLHDPVAANLRSTRRELEVVESDLEGVLVEDQDLAARADVLTGFPLQDWTTSQRHVVRYETRSRFRGFRGDLIVALTEADHDDSAYKVETLPEPGFVVPPDDGDLGDDELGGDFQLPLW